MFADRNKVRKIRRDGAADTTARHFLIGKKGHMGRLRSALLKISLLPYTVELHGFALKEHFCETVNVAAGQGTGGQSRKGLRRKDYFIYYTIPYTKNKEEGSIF